MKKRYWKALEKIAVAHMCIRDKYSCLHQDPKKKEKKTLRLHSLYIKFFFTNIFI